MIGDTTHDLQLAANAGTTAVGVGYGAHAHDLFDGFETAFVAHSMTELHDWLLRHG
jgi:phosphoglycolate phosphatase